MVKKFVLVFFLVSGFGLALRRTFFHRSEQHTTRSKNEKSIIRRPYNTSPTSFVRCCCWRSPPSYHICLFVAAIITLTDVLLLSLIGNPCCSRTFYFLRRKTKDFVSIISKVRPTQRRVPKLYFEKKKRRSK